MFLSAAEGDGGNAENASQKEQNRALGLSDETHSLP
jgi:hypothetical protein